MTQQEAVAIYAKAITLSRATNQTVGDKNDYYITIEQLESIFLEEVTP